MKSVFELSLKRILKQRLLLGVMFLLPLVIALMPRVDVIGLDTFVFGIFGLVMMFFSLLMAKQIIDDRQSKTVVRIAASPINHRQYLLGHLLAYFMVILVQILLFFGGVIFTLDVSFTFLFLALIIMVVFGIMTICFSLFWFSLFKQYTTSISIYTVVANLMAVMGGMSFPLSQMPQDIKQISVVLPTYWYANGIDQAYEGAYYSVIISLLILLGFAIIFLLIGSKRRFE